MAGTVPHMADRQEVQSAFGEVLTIEQGDSLSPYSDVWAARVHGGDDPRLGGAVASVDPSFRVIPVRPSAEGLVVTV